MRRSLRLREKSVIPAVMQESTEATTTDGPKRLREKARKEDNDDEWHDGDEDEDERPAKRARQGSKNSATKSKIRSKRQRMPEQFRKVRGKLGLLARLVKDVPLEVIFEIFCYLEPGDLLRLARTSRDLRGILMSKTSENIWCTARRNVQDLPPRPKDLNEPQYAHLLFEAYCHLCDRRCDNVLWNFRMRSCKKCLNNFPYNDDVFQQDQPHEYRAREVLPTEDYDSLGNWEIAARYKEEFYALNHGERDAWIDRKEEEYKEMEVHSNECQIWLNTKLAERANKLTELRNERKEAILKRLEEIGWRAEAEMMIKDYRGDIFTNHKLVSQPRKLTDYGWNCMETELVQMLSEYQVERLIRQRGEALESRYRLFFSLLLQIESETDLRDPFPAAGDILTDPRIEALIWDTPFDEKLGDSLCRSKLLEYLPSIINDWRPAKVQEVLDILRKSRPGATISDLHLATSVFTCSSCIGKVLHYPKMFYHRCCHQSFQTSSRSDERLEVYFPFWFTRRSLGVWVSSPLVYNDSASQVIKKIVEACNLDPETTTVDDLHLANPLIECSSCVHIIRGRQFMRWPYLPILHMGHTFKVNSFGAETAQILAKEVQVRDRNAICCSHCHGTHGLELSDHLKEEHDDVVGIDTLPTSGDLLQIREHWYWNPRAVEPPGLYKPFVYKA
ncbi:hypothetical protein BDP27DRAFT_1322535 [Rhodocollybia butyracea]|uniref:F-box domain-containing protein n=1 Tax=Rhodocollybia butyracea TaxID=206335 RepID=A0A9P5U9Q3_9AGAR|nr:hypothetical protein BDP27DRAFT_1322535 [Rhodocollybia butyracea]